MPAMVSKSARLAFSHADCTASSASAIEPSSQPEFIPHLIDNANDPAFIGKLDAFAEQHIPANTRKNVRRVKSIIRYNADIRTQRLPEVVAWVDQRHPRAP